TDETFDGPEVKAMDAVIARTWNLVDKSLTPIKISPLSNTVPSTVDTRSDGYASILVARFSSSGLNITIKSPQSTLSKPSVTPMACYGRRHHHLRQQVHDVFKDKERSSEAIRFTGYLSGETLAIQLDEIQIDDTFDPIKEPVKIMNHEVKRLKRSRIPNVKVKMNDPNIIMEEYIRLEEETARKHGKVFNWETAKYGKIWYDEVVHNLRSVETEFPAIVFNDTLMSKPTVSSLNNEIDFRISFDESDDEDYTIIFEKNSFSYKIIMSMI
ncbi:hypothetical protein Tco_0541091, partial [Tanacetum coccineum]